MLLVHPGHVAVKVYPKPAGCAGRITRQVPRTAGSIESDGVTGVLL